MHGTDARSNNKTKGSGPGQLIERIKNNLIVLSGSRDGSNITNYVIVECTLQSDIKPEYQDQYRTIKND